jgi:2,4-dichlorophenol 6-monooxygenase
VLNEHASSLLLDSYEPERRAVTGRNVERSIANALNQIRVGQALGLDPKAGADANWAQLSRFFRGRPEDAEYRREVLRMLASQSMEFGEHNVEYGYTYASGAIVSDGSPAPTSVDEIRVYVPSTRPGAPLPHAEVENADGERRPLMDLVAPGHFLLIASRRGDRALARAPRVAAVARHPSRPSTVRCTTARSSPSRRASSFSGSSKKAARLRAPRSSASAAR